MYDHAMPATESHREQKYPTQQLAILAICRFAEPIASTSIATYLPAMVRSFKFPENEIGKWAGRCSAMFTLCQAVMAIPWVRFSNLYGRKVCILIGLCTTFIASLMLGFSTSLPMAFVARGLAGAANGNTAIYRTTIPELVPSEELRPRAFNAMSLVWNAGAILGPAIGGILANPFKVGPREHVENPNLLQKFPYALPNIVTACLFAISTATGFLFLEETLMELRGHRDLGRVVGRKTLNTIGSYVPVVEGLLRRRQSDATGDGEERESLLETQESEEEPTRPPSTGRRYSEKQAVLNVVAFIALAFHTMAFDQLLTVYMTHPTLSSGTNKTTASIMTRDNPLKFAGGFGLSHFRLGIFLATSGILEVCIQFFLYTSVVQRFGLLNSFKVCAIAFPIAYFLTPFTALLPTPALKLGCMFVMMMIKCSASSFAFSTSNTLIARSSADSRRLGTMNGLAVVGTSISRAAGLAICGEAFTFGVNHGYVIAPWWLFCAFSIVAAIPVWFLEGETGKNK